MSNIAKQSEEQHDDVQQPFTANMQRLLFIVLL